MRNSSLTFRVLLLATIWSAVAIVVIALVISTLYRRGAERGFEGLLHAQLYNVINSVSVDDAGKLTGSPQLGNLDFQQPASGWYWMVEPIGDYKAEPLVSSSLGDIKLPVISTTAVPFDANYERLYSEPDGAGNTVMIAETEVIMDNDGRIARFRVAGNTQVVEDDVRYFSHRLYLALGVFGFGSLVINALAILLGLRPLDRARKALEKIRGGESEKLPENFPREIQPLANEVNALIESNRRIVERARMQVGNLAHSLKTPIAVLLNESRVINGAQGELVRNQADTMQAQVQSYLNRARIAAQRDTVLARAEIEPVLERLVRVMRRLNDGVEFTLTVEPKDLMLAMEAQDLEETVGNLLENAARFAKGRVAISVARAVEETGSRPKVEIVVEDDGPGLEPGEIKEAMKRGRRLDESKPGTGLGLSIVKEIATEYEGDFALSRGAMGGLRARLLLPALIRENT
ncbi:ATP-binding protein [Rhizobium sp. NRK18]|uniref:ATP-binding protein n=1 Tax=Rhizobium sp. NRK18 TaxID=2964667 RepID=UPI0021C4A0AA|nr:ATP-binding protein [Rhizobium sp. NRK18]MCQ2004874.1 ATP-binding protein [Rhizobium sp. NRK18]